MEESEIPAGEAPATENSEKKVVKRTRARSTTPRKRVAKKVAKPADESGQLDLAPAAEAAPARAPQPAEVDPAPAADPARKAPAESTPKDRVESPVSVAPDESNSGGTGGAERSPASDSGSAAPRQRSYGDKDGDDDDAGGGRWRRGKKGKKGKGKWGNKKGGDRERPPAQPLPPGMGEINVGELPDPADFADFEVLDAKAASVRESESVPIPLNEIYKLGVAELGAKGQELGATIEGVPGRRQWLEAIFKVAGEKELPMWDKGWLDMTDDGYGFIVHSHVAYRLYSENAYVPASLIKRYGLKRGHELEVIVQPPKEGVRCPSVVSIETVNNGEPADAAGVTPFEELEPYYPLARILMEAPIHKDISMRAVDLLTPIGFGQRGLIVAPPRTGKTVLLQNMANSVSNNFPEAKLILLLIDERPEEVTDFKRHTKGEVVSSTFDEAPSNHVHAAEMVIEKARRLVELGEHVVILLDSITRLARAYNALASNSGKIMSGGIEATALQKPKRFFGSARNIEGKGSLTILGTALIDTGSRMDEVIFEEFKGTGNMELHLDRGLSDKRIFPAINIDRSGTRKEELIYHPQEMERVYGLRRAMQGIPPVEAMEMFIKRLRKTKTNAEFLMSLKS